MQSAQSKFHKLPRPSAKLLASVYYEQSFHIMAGVEMKRDEKLPEKIAYE
jgi:hypothetical protein